MRADGAMNTTSGTRWSPPPTARLSGTDRSAFFGEGAFLRTTAPRSSPRSTSRRAPQLKQGLLVGRRVSAGPALRENPEERRS